MKSSTKNLIYKILIAIASALAGVISGQAMN
ncbi:smalltalk protein [Bacteroides sp. 51]|nr:smalltalk protein [Bacteroides sp. 51]